MHDHLLRLDGYLGAFLDSLARRVPRNRTIVALSADHGVQPFPEDHFRDSVGAALRIDVEPALTRAQNALRAKGVDAGLALDFEYGMVFADSAAFARAGLSRDSVLRDIAGTVRAIPGVARVDFVRDLARADTTRDVIARRWLHALPADLGVELVVTPKPYVYWQGVRYATHGTPNDEDARVPIAFMGPGFARGRRITRMVRTVDIAPTLAARLGLVPAERLDGVILTDAFASPR
jgi:predicted AlkP superfamily pyrophosphatase or phosphodiesterase